MRVLLIEDSPRFQRSITAALRHSNYAVDNATDGEVGLWLATNNDYDVIILDLMLPKLDGLTLLQRLRRCGKRTHVLILTARAAVEDRVSGLQLGADDYLVKPFALEELLARVQSLCRRRYGEKDPVIALGDLAVDTVRRCAACRGRALDLTALEYLILEYLAHCRNRVVQRAEIEAHVYCDDSEVMSNVIEVTICKLRKKLAEAGAPPLIETRRGLGYVIQSGV